MPHNPATPLKAASPFEKALAQSSLPVLTADANAVLPSSQLMGDAGSRAALSLIQEHLNLVKQKEVVVNLQKALAHYHKDEWQAGIDLAEKVTRLDPQCGEAWHVLAVGLDKCNALPQAFKSYEEALKRLPDNAGIANDLGRLAYRLNHTDIASRFFRFYLKHNPGDSEAINNLASALREESRFDEAIDLLKAALGENPDQPALWNVLGTILSAQGDAGTATLFYEQAHQLDPGNVHAIYNLGNSRVFHRDIDAGLKLLHEASERFLDPSQLYTARLSVAFAYLSKGDIETGWKWYEARHKEGMAEKINYLFDCPRWTSDQALKGKRVFVSAEQGLGDEIMFGTMIPDLVREVGSEGHVTIAVETRLVPLFQRSFPQAHVVRHLTAPLNGLPVRIYPDIDDWSSYDGWLLMGDLLPRYRNRIEDFPASSAYLVPDPVRVDYWRGQLSALNGKPKIGVLWKSLISHSRRNCVYTPFQEWRHVLSNPDLQFVNLQYGDTAAELEQAKVMGLNIWTPPDLDLKNDLDDVAALCAALDCIVGPSNATSNLAGACGGRIWILLVVSAWTQLGTDHLPWYKTSRVFASPSMLDWQPIMETLDTALKETFGRHKSDEV